MDRVLNKKFEEINKFIFVKEYEKAFNLLETLLQKEEAHENILIHLRRIELGLKIRKQEWFLKLYQESLKEKTLSPECVQICIALTEMFADSVPSHQSVETFTEILENYGESAGAYFGLAFSLESMGNLDRAIYNYKQSIKKDPEWYPSYFGLSQSFYRQNDQENGDHFFYLFEKFAPFNLYGNFETHRKLSEDFMNRGLYREAEQAIQLLVDWWIENKGSCPCEVEVYEKLMLLQIAKHQKSDTKICQYENSLNYLNEKLLREVDEKSGTGNESLYFVAKSYEEFSKMDIAFEYYRKILTSSENNPEMIERISQQLMQYAEPSQTRELFQEVYSFHPEDSNIRFCRLVSHLRVEKVPVEEYLEEKEKIRHLWDQVVDKTELLDILYRMLEKFPYDPDTHEQLGEIYQTIEDRTRALEHFRTMHSLDPHNRFKTLKLASLLNDSKRCSEARPLIDSLSFDPGEHPSEYCELVWLRSCCLADSGNYQEALKQLEPALSIDPWNIHYLASEIIWRIRKRFSGAEYTVDPVLISLCNGEDERGDWQEFTEKNSFFIEHHEYAAAYARSKLYFLYKGGNKEAFDLLLQTASQFDANRGRSDLIRLLNTNFDSPEIYLGLGRLSQELWDLQTAEMWFAQLLRIPVLSDAIKVAVYTELADCYMWGNRSVKKGLEYIKMISEISGSEPDVRHLVIELHACLRLGQISQAKIILEKIPESNMTFEAHYLSGLLLYRNGMVKKAKVVWKPLLTMKSDCLKTHHIKQELMKFYFNGESYLKAN